MSGDLSPADFSAHLDAVLIGGKEQRPIVIVDYDPTWPDRFAQERRRIMTALGSIARQVEHIGSTAVPGLAAKPIIDIIVTLDDVDDEGTFVPQLAGAGYLLRVREPGHRMMRSAALDVHVHLWPESGHELDRHVRFRDQLRASPADRAAYASLKRSLAEREWEDMNFYARAKGDLIAEILGRATSGPTASEPA
jgi:GrpB-like predicted nucleotidyltransferase (UPF0157 family)